MIPLQDVIPPRRLPLVTIVLMLLNVVAFFAGRSLAPGSLGAWPARAAAGLVFHPSWPHLAIDLLLLWIFGENVEDRLGRARFALLYVACGLVAAWAQAVNAPSVPSAGASGAIAGVLGAYLVLFPQSRVLLLVPLPFVFDVVETPAVYLLAAWVLAQVVLAFGVPVAGAAALLTTAAGFLAGAGAIWVLGGKKRKDGYWA